MGRPVGSREVEVWQIKKIVEKSLDGKNRGDIADAAEVSRRTVYAYQRSLGLI